MTQTEDNLGLSDEDLVGIDKEVMEHALWFTAEDSLHSDEEEAPSPEKAKEQNNKDAPSKDLETEELLECKHSDLIEENIAPKDPEEEKLLELTYSDLIKKEEQNIQTLLKAHFLEKLDKKVTTPKKEDFIIVAEDYHLYLDGEDTPEDIRICSLIEAYYLLDDFLEEADDYDDNPVYFLKKTTNYPLPADILEKAQNMSDEEIVYFFAEFCNYDEEEEETILKNPEEIKSKDIMSIIQKLATLEQID